MIAQTSTHRFRYAHRHIEFLTVPHSYNLKFYSIRRIED